MNKKYWIEGYGQFEYKPWDDLKGRDVRYICTDYEDDPEGIDLYEITDPTAPDFGECYATKLPTTNLELAQAVAFAEIYG